MTKKKKTRTLSDDQREKLTALFTKRLSAIQEKGSAPTALTYESIGVRAACTPLTVKRYWDKYLAAQGLQSKFGKIKKAKKAGAPIMAEPTTRRKNGRGTANAPDATALTYENEVPNRTPVAAPADDGFKAWLQLGVVSGYAAKLMDELQVKLNRALFVNLA